MTDSTILNMDAAEALGTLPDKTLDLVVTSPPYDNLRYYAGHDINFEATALELARCLTDGGVICWNVGDQTVDGSETLTSCKQKIFFREKCGLLIHDTMIYNRLNFSAPERTRYHQGFEYVFILSRGRPKCFNPIMDRKNAYAGQTSWGKSLKRKCAGNPIEKEKVTYSEIGMRTNVWTGKTRGQEEGCVSLPHPAMMPKWLARDLILSWSNPGDLVADPYAGSGTVGSEAIGLGRRAWLNDADKGCIPLLEQACSVTRALSL